MARTRPTASDVKRPALVRLDGRPSDTTAGLLTQVSAIDRGEAPTEELARIVVRASRLGFCVSRVATALAISPQVMASIQQRIAVSAPDGQTTPKHNATNGTSNA